MSPVQFPEESNAGGLRQFDAAFLQALELSRGLPTTPANLARVGKLTSVSAAQWAFGQWELRKRAKAKFESADRMFFSREALEQASGDRAARYHAQLFPAEALVTDLTVGIGGDLIELAKRGPAIGFDLDPDRLVLASLNLEAMDLTAELRHEDSIQWLSSQTDAYVYCDPARRVEGRRVASPDDFQPNPREIASLGAKQALCVIKLSPLLSDPFLESLCPRLEFISADGECKEALCILGREAVSGRYAVLVEHGLTLAAEPPPTPVQNVSDFVYECDPAAIRAHALGGICRELGLNPLADSNGYLTGPGDHKTPWLKGYRTLYEGPGDLKTTRRKLVELGSATPVIKQRLTNLDLASLRKALLLDGKRPLVLICYPLAKRVRHVITETLS